jgi:plasmid stabilization system protein ParE
MAERRVEIHIEAQDEAHLAFEWYLAQSAEIAEVFQTTLDSAIAQIATSPCAWPRAEAGTRRYLLPRFPYLVIYRVYDDRIFIVAVAHARRQSGYWVNRQ